MRRQSVAASRPNAIVRACSPVSRKIAPVIVVLRKSQKNSACSRVF